MPVDLQTFVQDPDYQALSPDERRTTSRRGAVVPTHDLPDDLVPPDAYPDMRKAGAASARQDPQFQRFARATIPAIGAGLSFIPGLGSVPAQMLLGGGATSLNQALGMEPVDPQQIGISMLAPPLIKGAVNTVRAGAKGLAELVAPGAVREGATEAIAKVAGAPAQSIERIFATPASRAAFTEAQQAGPVVTDEINNAITGAVNKLSGRANPPKAAVAYLTNLGKKYPVGATADYGDVVDELQTLKATADKAFSRGDVVTGRALNDTRANILDALDQVSPKVRHANALYKTEQAQQAIVTEARKGNPGVRMRELLENDKLVSSSLNRQQVKDILSIADAASDVGSAAPAGIGSRLLSAVSEPFAQLLSTDGGRAIIRGLMGPGGKITPVTLATIGQFGRAYLAQQRRIQAEAQQPPTAN